MPDIYGPDCTTSTPITSSGDYDAGTYAPYNIIRNDANTWYSAGSFPHWIQLDFREAPRNVVKLRMQTGVSYYTESPKDFTLEASNTGAWGGEEVTLLTVTGLSWTANEWKEWTFSNGTAYQYYRIVITANENNGTESQICEIEMFESVPDLGSDLCTGGTATASDSALSFEPEHAFDDDAATYWETNDATVPAWIQYDFGAGNAKRIERLHLQGSNEALMVRRVPKDFTLKASNTGAYGGEEVTLLSITGLLYWAKNAVTEWNFTNTNAYRYYRVTVTEIQAWYAPPADYLSLSEIEMFGDAGTIDYDAGTSSGGLVFGGEITATITADLAAGISSGGLVFGGEAVAGGTPAININMGVSSGGLVFGGEVATTWTVTPNNLVAVGVDATLQVVRYRIGGVYYELAPTMSYPGLGNIVALIDLGDPPATPGLWRYDIIVYAADGTVDLVKGTEAAIPVMPTIPAGHVMKENTQILRYYGQTIINQADIGKLYQAPTLAVITAVASDTDLAWAETTSTITVTLTDQYGQLYRTNTVITASITSGNGTITPASKSTSSGSTTFTYTRGGADPGDISPYITFTTSTGLTAICFVILRDVGGDMMI
jgi:hypothetical protein